MKNSIRILCHYTAQQFWAPIWNHLQNGTSYQNPFLMLRIKERPKPSCSLEAVFTTLQLSNVDFFLFVFTGVLDVANLFIGGVCQKFSGNLLCHYMYIVLCKDIRDHRSPCW